MGVTRPKGFESRVVACVVEAGFGAGTYYWYCPGMGHRIVLWGVKINGYAKNIPFWDIMRIWIKVGHGIPADLAAIQRWKDVFSINNYGGYHAFDFGGRGVSMSLDCGMVFESPGQRFGAVVHKMAGSDWGVNVSFEISEY
jgi:hypothetical protein